MKKILTALCCLVLLVSLTACGRETPYRVDTVVRIPVDPTEAPAATSAEPETEMPTQSVETEDPTEETKSSEKKPSDSKNNSNKNNSDKKPASGNRATEPPATKPAETEPPVTEIPATLPSVTEPGENEVPTLPSVTEPAETESLPTLPSVTVPPETVPETEPPYDPSSYAVGSLEYAILAEINAARVTEGIPELTLRTRLCGIAAVRAGEVSRTWSHNRPDGSYYTSVLSEYGQSYGTSAEHLCYVSGSGDGDAIVSKWMNGENRDSLLSAGFTTVGIGVYRSGGVTYVACILIG